MTRYPKNHISYNNVTSNFCSFLSSKSNPKEPSIYQEAIANQLWNNAMQEELGALEKMILGQL